MDSISPLPGPAARPLLALDRDDLSLSSRRGGAARGSLTIRNRGDAPLMGGVTVRDGGAWLRVAPTTLYVPPRRMVQVEARADPATLPAGNARGMVEIATNGGTVEVPVRLSVGVPGWRGLWRPAAGILAACAVAAILTGIVLAGLNPASRTASPARPTATARYHRTVGTGALPAPAPSPTVNREQALRDIRQAIANSDAVWQEALTIPSAAALASVKTGGDLARTTAEVQDLVAHNEHWQIESQDFRVLGVALSADGRSGTGEVEKTERRALYGPDHPGVPYAVSTATYRLRYHLVRQEGGRWLVDDVAVLAVTPQAHAAPLPSTLEVSKRVAPVVMHVEADGVDGGIAVGTGIIIRSGAAASYIVTNDHVVSGASAVRLQRWVWNGRTNTYAPASAYPWLASRVWQDRSDDLAVIRIAQGNLPVATWGNSAALQPGQQIVAIGYAENLAGGPTVTNGIVSNLQRTLPGNPAGPTFIQHTAFINPGNSGGPLADMSGQIVGINTWSLDNTQGLFFAIPSARILRVTANIIGTNG